jgi:hypothetical protein
MDADHRSEYFRGMAGSDQTPPSENSTEEKARLIMEPLSTDAGYALVPERLAARVSALSGDLLQATSAEPGVGASVSDALRWAAAPLPEDYFDGISETDIGSDAAWDPGFFTGFGYVVAITAGYLDFRLDDPEIAAELGAALSPSGSYPPDDVVLGALIESDIRGALVLGAVEEERRDEGFGQRVRAVLGALEASRSTFEELADHWDEVQPAWRDPASAAEPWRQVVVGALGAGLAFLGRKRCRVSVIPWPWSSGPDPL